MKLKHVTNVLLVWCVLAVSRQAPAASLTYFLTDSNALPDGPAYLAVTIADGVGDDSGDIIFTVDANESLFCSGGCFGDNFGIQTFGFNSVPVLTAANLELPDDWVAGFGGGSLSEFGKSDIKIKGKGSSRQDPLVFHIVGIEDDTIESYGLGFNNEGDATAWFAAHVAGFNPVERCGESSMACDSAWFGGGDGGYPPGSVVPVPAAAWLFGSGLLGMVGVAMRSRKA
jgi:hypothetical protein